VKRREFIALLGGTLIARPRSIMAQSSDVRRLGVLLVLPDDDALVLSLVTPFFQGLQELGWVDGRNIRIDYRWEADAERARVHVAELVGLKPDVILTDAVVAVKALQEESRSIPIVFVQIGSPVEAGLVSSIAHPGGKVTGFTREGPATGGKSLQMLKEIAPHITRVAVILSNAFAWAERIRAIEAVAAPMGVLTRPVEVHDAAEIDRAIDAFAIEPSGGLIVLPDFVSANHREQIIALADWHRLPAIYPNRIYVTDGGLISYGADQVGQFRRAASYVDRILKGADPADLPVQQPIKFELFINMKTAKELGLTVPQSLLVLADQVIE
jgi:putative ABC transport system substrate-binding protein